MKLLSELINETSWDNYQNHKYDDDVKSAIHDYVAGYTSGVNDVLRKGSTRGCKEVVKLLDEAFDSKYASKGKLDVWRTVDWDYVTNIYGCTKENIKEYVDKKYVCLNKGYMSTTNEFHSPWGSKWNDYDVVLHITSDFDYPYIDVNKVFQNDNEIDCAFQKEILLPRNTKMEMQSFEVKNEKHNKIFHKDGNYVLELKIIK